MAACFATLQQFSELENCFIDGTPMNFDEPLTPLEKLDVGRWDVANECGSGHDTGSSESLDTEMLRKREAGNGKFASHSGWTGYSPDECYSPASGHGILAKYSDERWQKLPNNIPSSQEKVVQWMSFEDVPYRNDYKPTKSQNSAFVEVQDRRSIGRRSRGIIMRFEQQERRQRAWIQESSIYQTASEQTTPGTQDSRTTRRNNMHRTSGSMDKPLPALPRKGPPKPLKIYSATDFDRMQRGELSSSPEKHPLAVTGETVQPEQQIPMQPRQIRSEMTLRRPLNEGHIMMQKETSKSPSTKSPTRKIIRSQSPKPLQLITKVGLQSAEQAQRHTMPNAPTGRDEALRKLEDKPLVHSRRARSETISKEVIRETLGLASEKEPVPRASVEQIETVLSKPSPVGRKERPRPAPIDMSAVLEANRNYLQHQIEILTETRRRDSGVDCHSPEELLHIEHPSALIPRPLSLPFKNSAPGDSLQIMSPVEKLESDHDRYMRHQKFFDNRPLLRCLDGDGVDEIADELFDRILEETKLYEARQSVQQQYQKRAFWDNVRLELDVADDDDDVSEVSTPVEQTTETPKSAGTPMRHGQCVVNVYPPDEE